MSHELGQVLGAFLPMVLLFLTMVVAMTVSSVRYMKERRAFGEAAARLGLRLEKLRWPPWRRVLVGTRDDVQVRVSMTSRQAGRSRVRYVTYEAYGPLAGVEVAPRGSFDGLLDQVVGRPVKLGDAAFDADVVASGDEAQVRASLPAGARVLVREFLVETKGGRLGWLARFFRSRRARIEGGRVESQRRGRARSADEIVAEVERVVAVARALSIAPGEVRDGLARVLGEDPVPAVRLGALAALAGEGLGAGHQDAVRAALQDADGAVRARAAVVLGDEAGLRAAADDPAVPGDEKRRVAAALEAQGLAGAGRLALADRGGEIGLAAAAPGVGEEERAQAAAEQAAREAAEAEARRAVAAGKAGIRGS